jgi:hypothetical protein
MTRLGAGGCTKSSLLVGEPDVPAYSRLRMPWKHPQVLGLDLNRSETGCLVADCADVDGPAGLEQTDAGFPER